MHRPPFVLLPLHSVVQHPAHQAQARRLDLYLFLYMFEKGMSISETISMLRLFTDATQSLHSSISWKNGRIERGGVKRENPCQIIIHGEGIFLSGLPLSKPFPNTSPSLSALTSANQRAWVQVFLGGGGGGGCNLEKGCRISETIANESTVAVA